MNLRLSAAIATFALLAACKSEEKPSGQYEDVIEARATVVAVDHAQRMLTLKDQDGVQVVVSVSPDVKNLGQVQAGDEVAVSYKEALSWKVKPAGAGAPGVTGDATMSAAAPGSKPGLKAGRSVTLTAKVTALDVAKGTVTLTGPAGNSLTLMPREPEKLKKVAVGDLVDVQYSETVAIGVQPVAPRK